MRPDGCQQHGLVMASQGGALLSGGLAWGLVRHCVLPCTWAIQKHAAMPLAPQWETRPRLRPTRPTSCQALHAM